MKIFISILCLLLDISCAADHYQRSYSALNALANQKRNMKAPSILSKNYLFIWLTLLCIQYSIGQS
ncbi:MAG: hypothetical protein AAGG75_04290, partial [Bacteroidota bacterium]